MEDQDWLIKELEKELVKKRLAFSFSKTPVDATLLIVESIEIREELKKMVELTSFGKKQAETEQSVEEDQVMQNQ